MIQYSLSDLVILRAAGSVSPWLGVVDIPSHSVAEAAPHNSSNLLPTLWLEDREEKTKDKQLW